MKKVMRLIYKLADFYIAILIWIVAGLLINEISHLSYSETTEGFLMLGAVIFSLIAFLRYVSWYEPSYKKLMNTERDRFKNISDQQKISIINEFAIWFNYHMNRKPNININDIQYHVTYYLKNKEENKHQISS